jgi:hypothetical protein
MDILDLKLKREELKNIAKRSLLFSVDIDSLNEFLRQVDLIDENDKGLEYVEFLLNKFRQEKSCVIDEISKVLNGDSK